MSITKDAARRQSPQTEVPTYAATIYLGLREGYEGRQHTVAEAQAACKVYCDAHKLCVTITPTQFAYVSGQEQGVAVGLINYPRFPTDKLAIRDRALDLAEFLKARFAQNRVTVVFPDQTVMLGEVVDKK